MINFPNAKINLGLNIISRRSDGYHNIETIFYPIDLFDALEIVPMKKDEIETNTISSQYRFFQSGLEIDADNENNLVIKALNLIKQEKEIPSIDIHLLKKIPLGAGLGGGSSDAAAMLHLLNNKFKLGYSEAELMTKASILGADCSFFIKNKPTLATGIGNVFEDIELDLKQYAMVVVKPNIYVNTKEAYSMIVPKMIEISLKEIIKMPIEEWREVMKNDFETPIFEKFPQIRNLKERMYDLGAIYAAMSGSGSSVFGIFDSPPHIDNEFDNNFVWTTTAQNNY